MKAKRRKTSRPQQLSITRVVGLLSDYQASGELNEYLDNFPRQDRLVLANFLQYAARRVLLSMSSSSSLKARRRKAP
jgi:hypothetical protein